MFILIRRTSQARNSSVLLKMEFKYHGNCNDHKRSRPCLVFHLQLLQCIYANIILDDWFSTNLCFFRIQVFLSALLKYQPSMITLVRQTGSQL